MCCVRDGRCFRVRLRGSLLSSIKGLFTKNRFSLPQNRFSLPLSFHTSPSNTLYTADIITTLFKMYASSLLPVLFAFGALSSPYIWREAFQNSDELLIMKEVAATIDTSLPGTPCMAAASHTLVPPTAKPSPPSDDKVITYGPPTSGGVSLLTTINKWRKLYNKNTLTWSDKLAANARKTGVDNHGKTENHELNPGSFAQVITPGAQSFNKDLKGDTPFELCFVGWLCEVPSDPQLKKGTDQCALVKNVLNLVYGSTGHHDILTSANYKSIGCAFTQNPDAKAGSPYQGLWVCDLGF